MANSSTRSITVTGLPRSEKGKWKGVSITPVVIASAIHRAYGVHTDPGMVTMGQRSCTVELASEREQGRVFKLYQKGVKPVLHSSDKTPRTLCSLMIDNIALAAPTTSVSSLPKSAQESYFHYTSRVGGNFEKHSSPGVDTNKSNITSAVLEISGLHTGENKVKTAFVMASMIHNTFGVKTDPSNVRFNEDQTAFWIELEDLESARRVLKMFESGLVPVLHTKDSHYPARLRVSTVIDATDAAISDDQDIDFSVHPSWLSDFMECEDSEALVGDAPSPTCTGPAFDSFFLSS